MAIDMSTVTSITLNNQDVTKIEDSLGNVLWQKGSGITYPYMFMSNGGYAQYTKDVNVEWTWRSVDTIGPFFHPWGPAFWSDGTNLYCSRGNNIQWIYTGSLDYHDSSKWVTCSQGWSDKVIYGYNIFKINNELYNLDGIANNYKYDPNTDTWNSVTITGADSSMNVDTLWTDGTDIYWNTSSTTIKILDKNTLTWGSNITVASTDIDANYTWTDGDNIYYSNGSTHKVWDKANRNWIDKTWYGLTSFYGTEVFFYNGEIYVGSEETNYPIYKLSNQTWTQSYPSPNNSQYFRGARMWDLGGRSTAATTTWLMGLRRPNK